MVKVSISGRAYAISSNLPVADIEILQKYKPDALKLKDKDGNDVFTVAYREGKDSVSRFGVEYGSKSNNGAGLAVYTGNIPAGVADVKEYVADQVSVFLENLETVEEQAAKAVTIVKQAKADLVSNITVQL